MAADPDLARLVEKDGDYSSSLSITHRTADKRQLENPYAF
jgi:hypothetical protein